MATMTSQEMVDVANSRVGIVKACQIIGMDAPDFGAGSVKLYCPFGEMYHTDGGRTRAFKVYPNTNSAWCFACSKFYTPVMLVSQARDVSESDAAEYLLDITGYVAPDSESRWKALMEQTLDFDHAAEREALKLFCARLDPQWPSRQFEPDIAALLTKCFTPLGKVATQDDLQRWRETTRSVMTKALTQRQET